MQLLETTLLEQPLAILPDDNVIIATAIAGRFAVSLVVKDFRCVGANYGFISLDDD